MNTDTDLMLDSADPEERAILLAIDALASGDTPEAGSGDDALRRLYVEVLGLLPAALDPEPPAARVWQRVAAELDLPSVEASAATPAPVVASVVPSPAPTVEAATDLAPRRATVVPFAAPAPVPTRAAMRRHARWPLALAATLALSLAGLSLFLVRNLDEQSDKVSELYVKLAAAEREVSSLRQASGKLTEMEEKYSLVTDPGVSVNRLASTGQPSASNASGILFVAADHNHWVLSLSGLPAAEVGKGYQLWFMGETTAVSGGTFTARVGEKVELSAASMPAGTRAIVITIEPAAGSPLPSGPRVLTTVG